MSLAEKPDPFIGPAADDPFYLGIRYAPRTLPNGEAEHDPTPLTPEDLLSPEEEDRPVHHPAHAADCGTLVGCLQFLLARVPGSLVLADCRVDFAIPDVKPLGPDVAVFLNAPEGWSAATLDVRPVLVAEVTSPESRPLDLARKIDLYHRANIPSYVIVDSRYTQGQRFNVRLLGFRHTPDRYEPIPLDDQGRLRIDPVNLWLQVAGNQVVGIDGRTGQPIEPFVEPIFARQAAEAQARAAETRLVAEAAARRDPEAQLEAMQAELRRLLPAARSGRLGPIDPLEAAARINPTEDR